MATHYNARQEKAIRDTLDRIAQEKLLGNSKKLLQLLRYLIEETLAGREDEITPYNIAVDAMGREKDFDPAGQSVIRVEMYRLRRALKKYNQSRPENAVKIEFAKQSYIPNFSGFPTLTMEEIAAENALVAQENAVYLAQNKLSPSDMLRHLLQPSYRMQQFAIATAIIFTFAIVVISFTTQFDVISSLRQHVGLSSSCSYERPLVVFRPLKEKDGDPQWLENLYQELHAQVGQYTLVEMIDDIPECLEIPVFILKNDYRTTGQKALLNFTVSRLHSPEILWSENIMLEDRVNLTDLPDVVAQIAYELAHADGIIPNTSLDINWVADDLEKKYQCLMGTHVYFQDNENASQDDQLVCMREYAETEEKYADIVALYAAMINAMANQGNFQSEYKMAMEKAKQIDENDLEYLIIYLRELSKGKDQAHFAKMNEVMLRLKKHYPTVPQALIQAAFARSLYMGDWEEAKRLMARAPPGMLCPMPFTMILRC